MKTPIVTIVGRPNVGKSTFFNKMAGRRIAIETSIPGTTRDRIFHKITNEELDYFLVDTGGLEFDKDEGTIEDDMRLQSTIAIDESDVILFMVSRKEELTPDDYEVAELLRKKMNEKPIYLVVNKCDNPLSESDLAAYYELGMGEPHQISAVHRAGTDALNSQIVKELKDRHFLTKDSPQYKVEEEFNKSHLKIALVGKPNVGKSSIINALLNKNKLIVSDIPGTTRDSTDSVITYNGKKYNFIDTAGLRRKGKIKKGIEYFSALRSMSAIDRADISLLVLDSSEKISSQDKQIIRYITEAGKGLIVLANKWDIKVDPNMDEEMRKSTFIKYLKSQLEFLSWAPVMFTSAITKKNLTKVFDLIEEIGKEREKRIQTRTLNLFIEKIVQEHKPSGAKSIRPKLFYVTQVDTNPPHFVAFVNKKKYFHFSYLRYLENRMREQFNFTGTPIKFEYREKESRFKKKK